MPKTLTLTDEQFETVKTALLWYRDDRLECVKHASDETDEAEQGKAASDAAALLDELEAL